MINVQLTEYQRDVLVERVDGVLEDTEDWQLSDDDFSTAIQTWIDMIRSLGNNERADYWVDQYKHIANVR